MVSNEHFQSNREHIRDLLSPYLDDEVTSEERALVEQELAGSAELRRELETLRQTVAMLSALPPASAPRPFTLTETDVRTISPKPRRSFFGLPNWLGGLAAAAAALICVVIIGGVLLTRQGGGTMAPEAPAELAGVPRTTAAQTAEEEGQREAAPTEPAEQKMAAAESSTMAETATATRPANEVTSAKEEMADEIRSEADQEAARESTATEGVGGGAGEIPNQPPAPALAATPTMAPMPTPSPEMLAAPAQESAEEGAMMAGETQPEQPLPLESEAPAPEAAPAQKVAQPEASAAPPEAEEAPTATSTPVPSPTAVAQLPAPPMPAAMATLLPPLTEQPSPSTEGTPWWWFGGLAVLAVLVVTGIGIWLIMRRPRP